MKYLLDTNAFIRYVNGSSQSILNKVLEVGDHNIAVSAISRAELSYGVTKSKRCEFTQALHESFLRRIETIDFDSTAASYHGTQRIRLEQQGDMIGTYDLLIACIALASDLILVTHNVREFSRIEGLRFEDWEV